MSVVGDLLVQSRQAHAQWHATDAQSVGPGQWVKGDQLVVQQVLQLAQSLRLQADALDPTHSDPEWVNDIVPHQEYLDFYVRYLLYLSTVLPSTSPPLSAPTQSPHPSAPPFGKPPKSNP